MSDYPLPDDDVYEVTECDCGHLTLRLGRVRVDLSREEFVLLRQAIAEAAERLKVALSPRRPVMH